MLSRVLLHDVLHVRAELLQLAETMLTRIFSTIPRTSKVSPQLCFIIGTLWDCFDLLGTAHDHEGKGEFRSPRLVDKRLVLLGDPIVKTLEECNT